MKDLFDLLPAIHRVRDAEQGGQLRALLAVVSREVQLVEQDITRLYDNWFIETCDEWVVPYIADLLGIRSLAGSSSAGNSGLSQRSYVANTRRTGAGRARPRCSSNWRATSPGGAARLLNSSSAPPP